ncbi:MAG: phosphoribosyltransferase family protein [Bacilli bacterium]
MLALYRYNDFLQSALFKLKGCGDIDIAPSFLNYHLHYLRSKYRKHLLIPAPSFQEHDEQRGFNHVEEIFKIIKLPIVSAIIKISPRKQTDLNPDERSKIGEILKWRDGVNIQDEQILLVDDVMTTGATIKACLKLIKKHQPKSIDVLVLSKARDKG